MIDKVRLNNHEKNKWRAELAAIPYPAPYPPPPSPPPPPPKKKGGGATLLPKLNWIYRKLTKSVLNQNIDIVFSFFFFFFFFFFVFLSL